MRCVGSQAGHPSGHGTPLDGGSGTAKVATWETFFNIRLDFHLQYENVAVVSEIKR